MFLKGFFYVFHKYVSHKFSIFPKIFDRIFCKYFLQNTFKDSSNIFISISSWIYPSNNLQDFKGNSRLYFWNDSSRIFIHKFLDTIVNTFYSDNFNRNFSEIFLWHWSEIGNFYMVLLYIYRCISSEISSRNSVRYLHHFR